MYTLTLPSELAALQSFSIRRTDGHLTFSLLQMFTDHQQAAKCEKITRAGGASLLFLLLLASGALLLCLNPCCFAPSRRSVSPHSAVSLCSVASFRCVPSFGLAPPCRFAAPAPRIFLVAPL